MKTLSIPQPSAYNTSALHRYIDKLDQQIKELRGSASMLYRKLIEVNFKFRMNETFFISNQDLMTITGFCWRTLNRAKKILEKYNLIQVSASRGRGHATVYSLRPSKDFAIKQESNKDASLLANSQDEASISKSDKPSKNEPQVINKGITIEELKKLTCKNPSLYNWSGFLAKMEEFNPDPEELLQLVNLSNYGEKGSLFWKLCSEITNAKGTISPIKQPVKFILSKYRSHGSEDRNQQGR